MNGVGICPTRSLISNLDPNRIEEGIFTLALLSSCSPYDPFRSPVGRLPRYYSQPQLLSDSICGECADKRWIFRLSGPGGIRTHDFWLSPLYLLEGQRSIQAELRTQYALEGTGLSW